MTRIAILTILSFIVLCPIKAQTLTEREEISGTFGGGEYTPFWHMSNRQGLSSDENWSVYTRNSIAGSHTFSKKGIGLEWEFDFAVGMNLTSRILVQQAYMDLNWKMFKLSIGQKERWQGVVNHRLSSGSLTESGNARPVPQIRFELPQYWDIPGTGGWIGIKGHIAYGMFTDGSWQKDFAADDKQYVKNALYHSKAGFIRIGNGKKLPLTAEFGLHMVAQFGGKCYNFGNEPGKNYKNPTRLKDLWTAFIPSKGDDSYHGMDQANIVGNMLGSWMAAITWEEKKWNTRLYYEHTFDDHSQMFMEYGLWTEQLIGIEIGLKDFKWIKGIAIEYFNLKNHSGPIYHDSTDKIPDQVSCRDSNYNHSWYGGWFNYGQIMGTPLCSSPIYNRDNKLTCYNNRVEAFHMGVEGSPLDWLDYRILLTRSNNWGTYNDPFKDIKQNISGMLEITVKPGSLKNWSVTASFAFDNGDLYDNNYGCMLSIKRYGVFNLNRTQKTTK
jgi:hypothetical protein